MHSLGGKVSESDRGPYVIHELITVENKNKTGSNITYKIFMYGSTNLFTSSLLFSVVIDPGVPKILSVESI